MFQKILLAPGKSGIALVSWCLNSNTWTEKKHGQVLRYDKGKIIYSTGYKNDKKHGYFRRYFGDAGQLDFEVEYNEGKHVKWQRMHKNGNKSEIGISRNGKRIILKRFSESGKLEFQQIETVSGDKVVFDSSADIDLRKEFGIKIEK